MATKTFLRSFAGGEVGPEMFGRIDDAVFQSGAREVRNFITRPQGPAFRRPGTRLVREVKDSTKRTRLIAFTYSTDQSLAIEIGHHYIRFHANGATLGYATPDAYVSTSTISTLGTGGFTSGVDTTNNVLDFTAAHNLTNGQDIYFYQTGGALPGGLTAGVRYYAVVTTPTRIKVAETAAAAIAGTPVVDITSAGSGTRTVATR